MRTLTLALAALACALLGAPAVHAQTPCTLQNLGALQVEWDRNRPLAPIRANGQRAYALVDTGAAISTLFGDAAVRLGLRPRYGGARARGMGGAAMLGAVEVPGFALVGDATVSRTLPVVATLWSGRRDVVMLLGQDVLRFADVEFNFAANEVRFFRAQGDCQEASLAYWDGAVVDVPIRRGRNDWLIADALLNGRPIRVMFDTGSPLSIVSLNAARAAGVSLESADTVEASALTGIGGARVDSWLSRFDSFALGGETVNHPRLRIVDFGRAQGLRGIDMLIGADFFRTHRVLAAYSQRRLYFTYHGGTTFQIVGPPAARTN